MNNSTTSTYDFKRGYKRSAISIAQDLGYGQQVIDKINNAKNDQEISTIMYVAAKKIGER